MTITKKHWIIIFSFILLIAVLHIVWWQPKSTETQSTPIEAPISCKDYTGNMLDVHGIDMRMLARLQCFLDNNINSESKTITLNFNSYGGSVDVGFAMMKAVEDFKQKTHKMVISKVEMGNHCSSMCTSIFTVGDKRYADPASIWLFHGAKIGGERYIPTPEESRELKLDAIHFQKIYDDTDKVFGKYLKDNKIECDGKDHSWSGYHIHFLAPKYFTMKELEDTEK